MATFSDGPAELELEAYPGDPFSLRMTITDGGTAVDITGGTFKGDIKYAKLATQTAAESFSFTIVDGPNGIVTANLTATQTRNLDGESMVYDIEWVTGSDTLLKGPFEFDREVTL